MFATTPNFEIRYPCAGDTIDCDTFANFTNDIQAALDAVAVSETAALNRPNAKITENGAQTIAFNTTTDIQFHIEEYDNNGMADLAVNNERLTIQTAGIYMAEAYMSGNSSFTTVSSQAIALSQNGTIRYRKKDSNRSNLTSSIHVVGLFNCLVGDVLRAVYLWTGSGGPEGVFSCEFQARLVSLPD